MIIGIMVGLLIFSISSFVDGRYFSALLQFVPPVILFLSKKYPDSTILNQLSYQVDPLPIKGMKLSNIAAERAFYYLKIVFIFILIFIIANDFGLDMQRLSDPLVIFVYMLPLMIVFLSFLTIFNASKWVYMKIFNKDGLGG